MVTVEDNALAGGFGSAILEFMSAEGAVPCRVKRVGLPDAFVVPRLLGSAAPRRRLDAEAIAELRRWNCSRADRPAHPSPRATAMARGRRIRLDELVVARGLAPSRSAARALIMAGLVWWTGR